MLYLHRNFVLHASFMKKMTLVIFGVLGFSSLCTAADAKQLYSTCAACHGKAGEGNAQLSAPNIAGMQAWYVETQLNHFFNGLRGTHPKDSYGAQMRAASMVTLKAATDRKKLATYVASLPKKPVAATAQANRSALANGSTRYNALCSACHASSGKGNKALGAPDLAGRDRVYLQRQLMNFRTGVRGKQPGDTYGKQMAAISGMLAEKDIADVVAYIGTLKP